MHKAIYKFPIHLAAAPAIHMHAGAEILHVGVQNGEVCAWALVNPKAAMGLRMFNLIGNGHPIERDPGKYLATVQLEKGTLVLHVFDATPPDDDTEL